MAWGGIRPAQKSNYVLGGVNIKKKSECNKMQNENMYGKLVLLRVFAKMSHKTVLSNPLGACVLGVLVQEKGGTTFFLIQQGETAVREENI